MRYQTTKMALAELIGPAGMISDGDWIESKDQNPEGIVRLVQLADIGEGVFIDKSQRFLTEQRAQELRCTFLQKGDLLIARMPDPIGRACIFPGDSRPSVTAVDVCIVRPDQTLVDINWLKHAFNSPTIRREIEKGATGTTRSRIATGKLKGLIFNLPPLAEQKRIAAILDKADSLRRKRAQAIALADDFLRATFLEMFGEDFRSDKGGWCPIGEATTFIDYRGKTPEKSDSGIPLLTAKNVKNGYLDVEPREYIPEDSYIDWMIRGFPCEGDLLFTTEAPLGNVALLPKYEKVALAQRVICMQPSNHFFSEYLLMALQHPEVVDQINARATGSTVKGIRSKELVHVVLPAPSKEKQKIFKNAFQSVASIKKKYGASESLLRDKQRSLATSFFVGT